MIGTNPDLQALHNARISVQSPSNDAACFYSADLGDLNQERQFVHSRFRREKDVQPHSMASAELLAYHTAKERQVHATFLKFADDRGDLTPEQLVFLMEALGLVEKMKSNVVPFLSEVMLRYDRNKDGVLNFDEFR